MSKIYIKTIISISMLIVLSITGCYIDGEPTVSDLINEQNNQAIQDYLSINNISAQSTDEGIFYVIDSSFIGVPPDTLDYIDISYNAYLLDGTLVDLVPETKPITVIVNPMSFIFDYDLREINQPMVDILFKYKVGQTGTIITNANIFFFILSNSFVGSEGISISASTPLLIDLKIVSSKSENQLIDEYIIDNNLTDGEVFESGVRYFQEFDPGIFGTDSTDKTTFFVKYEGKFLNNEVFDRNQTGNFLFAKGSNQVIDGFEEAVLGMKTGEKGIVIIPNNQAYGEIGNVPTIEPYTPIVFELELVNVE